MPTNTWHTQEIASYITELLYRSGANITDAFLGHIDIIIVVSEPDGRPTGLRRIATGSPKRTAAGDRRTDDLVLAT